MATAISRGQLLKSCKDDLGLDPIDVPLKHRKEDQEECPWEK